MLNLGDVWAITAVIVGVGVCAWALLLCMALLFQSRTGVAKEKITARPGMCLLTGLVTSLLLGTLSVLLLSLPSPLVKLLGWVGLLGLMALSFAGTAGLVALAGERVQDMDRGMSGYAALSRGAAFVVLPAVMPILGWFLYAPAVFCVGVGAGIQAVRARKAVEVPLPA
jgi:hypothetical protein